MDVFIYFPPELEIPRDEIEDAINDLLSGTGEVTGGGGGERGSNLDVEIFDEDHGPHLVERIKELLKGMGVPTNTSLVVDGQRSMLK